MINSKAAEYIAWSVGGLIVSLGTVLLGRHWKEVKGKQRIEDEAFRRAIKSIQQSADKNVRANNKYDVDILINRLMAAIDLHNLEYANQAKHFNPLRKRLEYALSPDSSYTEKMKAVRKVASEMLGRIKKQD